jgi:hypothetical protein
MLMANNTVSANPARFVIETALLALRETPEDMIAARRTVILGCVKGNRKHFVRKP